ncbi:vesicle trafficking protein SEC22b, partial [Aphelenchoides avenae]
MILLTLIARLKDGLVLVTSSEGADGADHNMEKYTRQAETLSRRLNAPDTPVLRSIMSGAFALLADVADAFLKQNGARVENVTKPYYFFEFGKYFEDAKRKCADGNQHAAQAANNVPQGVARTMVSNNKTVVQHVHFLITARQGLLGAHAEEDGGHHSQIP